MPKTPKHTPAPIGARHPSRISLLWPLFCLIGFVVVISLVVGWIMTADDSRPPAKPQLPAGQPTAGTTPDDAVRGKLVGRWFRPDGEYTIEIRSVQPDGKMDARYLNPNPINVSKAQVTRQGEQTSVYVELNDKGYPGSYYNLIYDVKQDRMAGTYVQKAMNQQFQVEFMRMPEER